MATLTASRADQVMEREMPEDLVIEDLDHPAPAVAAWTYCG